MLVATILSEKGATVATIVPTATVADAAAEMRLRGVGSLVVSRDGRQVLGIVSERDLVRRLAERGEVALREEVDAVMTREVCTCEPADTTEQLMAIMTEHRHRHVPVVVDGILSGLVSIGDIVKARVTELENESRAMHDYIALGR